MFQNNLLMAAASTASAAGYTVDYSCRFNTADTAVLSRANGTATSSKIATIAFWFKVGVIGVDRAFFGAEGFYTGCAFLATGQLYVVHGSAGAIVLTTTQVFRDPSAWYHCMCVFDTTESVDTDRFKLYINGAQVTDYTAGTFPTLNEAFTAWNTSGNTNLVADGHSTYSNYDGYLAEFHSTDGTAYTPTTFGEFDDYGVWRPIEVTGVTYGNNGFYFDFADSADLGNDVSGNDNDFTSSGLVAADQMTDTPTNNKCTWSSISHGPTTSAPVLSNGNLDITYPPADCGLAGTMGVIGSGKYYWEYEMTSGTGGTPAQLLGMVSQPYAWAAGRLSLSAGFRSYYTTGVKNTGGTESSYGDSWAVGDRMGVAVDLDNEAMYFAKNNTWQDSGDPTSGASKTGAAFTDITASDVWVPFMHTGGNRYSTVIFNEDDFEYTPPTGYVALATSNLPAPAIKDGTAHFQPTLYTGDGSVRNIDQTGNSTFQPDMVWIKNRSATDSHSVFDAILGVTNYWIPDTASVETTNADSLTSFDSDGFGLGTGAGGWNDNTENFVAWQWLAGGGAGSSNEEGSINTITTTVNTAAGISISTFTGNATGGATIGHGLGAAPEFMIAKSTTGGHPNIVYWKNLGGHYGTDMDLLTAPSDLATYWNDVDPTSSLITLGSGATNTSSVKMLIYAFTSIEGFSKIGSYTGNGVTDGPVTYTGFKPAYVMIRRTSSTGGWLLHDTQRSPHNLSNLILSAENASAESTDYPIDFLANGFKARDGNVHYINATGSTYAYIAFAEYPFGGDGATPATAF